MAGLGGKKKGEGDWLQFKAWTPSFSSLCYGLVQKINLPISCVNESINNHPRVTIAKLIILTDPRETKVDKPLMD